jgi:hypothetical protein
MMTKQIRFFMLSAILFLVACSDQAPSSPTAPQATATGTADTPDLSGYWMITFDAIPPLRNPTVEEQDFLQGLMPGAVLLSDSGLPEFSPGDYGGLVMQQSALDAARDFDPEEIRTVANTCKPPGLIYSMQGPFGIEIFQGSDLIVIKMEYYDATRVIFMNETSHPEDWPLSDMGHSIGHWDGDTLVVRTEKLRPSTLFNNGVDHSENIHVHERFRLSNDGSVLMVTQEFEDPDVFEGWAARLLPLIKDDDHVLPYDCDPSYGVDIGNREIPE